jgi:rare lipoprotein A
MIANAPPLTSPRLMPATGVVEQPVAETVAVAQAPVQRAIAEPAVFQTAAAIQPVRIVSDAPRPPERPYDLSTIPGAGTPITFAGAAPGTARVAAARPVVASLYFAKPEPVTQRFDPRHPLVRDLKPQRFVALR